jgi:hypothetical protein
MCDTVVDIVVVVFGVSLRSDETKLARSAGARQLPDRPSKDIRKRAIQMVLSELFLNE